MTTLCGVGAVADMCGSTSVVRQRKSSHNCIGETHKWRSARFLPHILLRKSSSFLSLSYLDCFSFEVHTLVSMKITRLWHRVVWYVGTKLFEKRFAAYIFRSYALKMEAENTSETLVTIYHATALHNSEYSLFHFTTYCTVYSRNCGWKNESGMWQRKSLVKEN
jgi:hypothetical protein